MFKGLGKFWKDLMCEDDGNTTYCPVRIFAASFVTLFHAAVIHQAFTGTFDPLTYAGGATALLTGTGAAIGVKSKLGADNVTKAKEPDHA